MLFLPCDFPPFSASEQGPGDLVKRRCLNRSSRFSKSPVEF